MTPRELMEAFGTLAEAPDGVKRLRELVLQLAVRGKLVPQVEGEEAASKILEQLGKGKIASQLEQPFALPVGWAWCRMAAVCDLVSGVAKGRKVSGGKITEMPYLRVANVQAGFLNLSVIKMIEASSEELEQYRLQSGDVLLTEGGDWDKLGRSAIWNGEIQDCIHQNHIFRARCIQSALLPRWLSQFTNSADGRGYFQSCSKQTTNLASINMTQLRHCPVPLPPLAEQHRIVAKVDELMAFLDKLEAAKTARDTTRKALRDAALAALREADSPDDVELAWGRIAEQMDELFAEPEDVAPLRQAVLQLAVRGRLVRRDSADGSVEELLEAVTKSRLAKSAKLAKIGPNDNVGSVFDVPSHWAWVSLGALVTDGPTNGWSPTTVDFETSTKTLKLSATTSGHFNSEKFKFVDAALDAESPLWLETGDLLVQRSNTPDYVGMAAVFDGSPKTFIYPDLMMRCRIAEPIPVEFVHLCLISPYGRSWFSENASGTSASMVKLGQAAVRATPIPLPPPRRTTPHRRQSRRAHGPARQARRPAPSRQDPASRVRGGGGASPAPRRKLTVTVQNQRRSTPNPGRGGSLARPVNSPPVQAIAMSPTNANVRKPLPRLREPGATYFITWRTDHTQPPLSHAERTLIADSIRQFAGTRYDLHAWVVMDDHVHVIASPIAPATVDQAIYGWRSFTASRLCRDFARRPPIWQRGGYDRVVWAGGELEEKIAYVVANPWKRWPDCVEYPWVWPLEGD